jgi:hypothetical protein
LIADLVPEPGRGPIAKEYRALADALSRVSGPDVAFRPQDYDPASVHEARARWKKRMVDEYGSTTVFSGLAAQLVEANATLDSCAVMLRMAQDEFRHAEICGRVVLAMGGSNRVKDRTTDVVPLPRHEGCGAEERALRNVLVTCVSETYSTAFFAASLERMTDPYLRAVTRELFADEVLHGRFGLYFLGDWADWLVTRPEVRASLSRYLRLVFATCEREFVRGPEEERPRGKDGDALGLVPFALGREIFEATMGQALAPALEHFGLDARGAWRNRSLEP